jgi:hypothetical protein
MTESNSESRQKFGPNRARASRTTIMSSSQPPEQPPAREDAKPSTSTSDVVMESAQPPADAEKMDVTPDPPAETWSDLPQELLTASAEEIVSRRRLIENDIRVSLGVVLRPGALCGLVLSLCIFAA